VCSLFNFALRVTLSGHLVILHWNVPAPRDHCDSKAGGVGAEHHSPCPVGELRNCCTFYFDEMSTSPVKRAVLRHVPGAEALEGGPRNDAPATTVLDVPQKKSALQTQTRRDSLWNELEKADQHMSGAIHRLHFGPVGDCVVFVPAFLFSAFSIPLVLFFLYFLVPLRVWTECLLGW